MERVEFVYDLVSLYKLVDGDTQDLTVEKNIDIGFYIHETKQTTQRFRLLGVDTPEKFGKNAVPEGQTASDLVSEWYEFHIPHGIRVHSFKTDSFGRWLAVVECSCGVQLNRWLLDTGIAEEF